MPVRQIIRFWLVVILLSGLLLVPLQAGSAQGNTGGCDALQLILLVDNSGSMSGKGGGRPTDPNGLRFAGPRSAVDLVVNQWIHSPSKKIDIALVYWGSRPEIAIPWTPIQPDTTAAAIELSRQLEQAILDFQSRFESLGETNVLGAFQAAISLFAQQPKPQNGCPERAIVMITDGQPYLSPEENGGEPFVTSEHMQQVKDLLQKEFPTGGGAPNRLYVLGINDPNDTTYWERTEHYWVDLASDPDRVGLVTNYEDLGKRLQAIVDDLLKDPNITITTICPGEVVIPPYLQWVSFTLYKSDMTDHLQIQDEQGAVTPQRQDMQVNLLGADSAVETLMVENPLPGRWQVKTALAGGTCDLQMRSIPARGLLLHPDPAQNDRPVQFVAMDVVFQVADADGNPLPDYSNPLYRLQLQARLRTPSGQERTLLLDPRPNNEYAASFVPLEAGEYTIVADGISKNARSETVTVFADQKMGSFVVQAPGLQIQPNLTAGRQKQHQRLRFKALVLGPDGAPMDPAYPTSVIVEAEEPGGSSQGITMEQTGTGEYQGEMTLDQAGIYHLHVHGLVRTPEGQEIAFGEQDIAFEAQPTTLISVQFDTPSDRFVATNWLGRATSYRLPFRVLDEQGQGVDPARLMENPQEPVFQVTVQDERGNSLPATLVRGTEVGSFEVLMENVHPGRYTITLEPAYGLQEQYLWDAAPPWRLVLNGIWNPVFWGLVALGILLILLVILCLMAGRRLQQYPLSGSLELEKWDELGQEWGYVATFSLPRQNRVVYGGLYWVWPCPLPRRQSKKLPAQFRRLEVFCRDEQESKLGTVHVRVVLKTGQSLAFELRQGAQVEFQAPGAEYRLRHPELL